MIKQLLILFYFCSLKLYSQPFPSVVCATGNLSNDFVYYNLGDILTTTLSSNSSILTQGFIQLTSADAVVVTINEKSENFIKTSVYPNPFDNTITLQIKNLDSQNPIIQIVDILGRAVPYTFNIESTNPNEKKYFINTSSFKSGSYFIQVIIQQQVVEIIKTIKL